MKADLKKVMTVLEAQTSAIEAEINKDACIKRRYLQRLSDIDAQLKESHVAINTSHDLDTIKLELKWQDLAREFHESLCTSLEAVNQGLAAKQRELAKLYGKWDVMNKRLRSLEDRTKLRKANVDDNSRLRVWRLILNKT